MTCGGRGAWLSRGSSSSGAGSCPIQHRPAMAPLHGRNLLELVDRHLSPSLRTAGDSRRRSERPRPVGPASTMPVSRAGPGTVPGTADGAGARRATLEDMLLAGRRAWRGSPGRAGPARSTARGTQRRIGLAARRARRLGRAACSVAPRSPSGGAAVLVIDQLAMGSWVLLFLWLVLIAYLLPDGRHRSTPLLWRLVACAAWWVVVMFVVGSGR